MARRRRRSPRRRRGNLMLHRTRNLGVVGTRGAGVIAHTMGPYYPRGDLEPFYILTEMGEPMLNEAGTKNLAPQKRP
jgi:hypothetical protein